MSKRLESKPRRVCRHGWWTTVGWLLTFDLWKVYIRRCDDCRYVQEIYLVQ